MDAACTLIVLSWLRFHPGPAEVAKGLRADVDEIERLCADVAAFGFTKRAVALMTSPSVDEAPYSVKASPLPSRRAFVDLLKLVLVGLSADETAEVRREDDDASVS